MFLCEESLEKLPNPAWSVFPPLSTPPLAPPLPLPPPPAAPSPPPFLLSPLPTPPSLLSSLHPNPSPGCALMLKSTKSSFPDSLPLLPTPFLGGGGYDHNFCLHPYGAQSGEQEPLSVRGPDSSYWQPQCGAATGQEPGLEGWRPGRGSPLRDC